jgi:hypothetical protein
MDDTSRQTLITCIRDLVECMEIWAKEEDGIPDWLWPGYQGALLICGKTDRESFDEELAKKTVERWQGTEKREPLASLKTGEPYQTWAEACRIAERYVREASFEEAGDEAIRVARELLGLANKLKGHACPKCDGCGERLYGTTAISGGAGGCQMTVGICSQCRGTGKANACSI